jgi:hypothetical protein
MSRRIAISLALAALALPAAARAGGPVLSVLDLPVAGARSPAVSRTAQPFDLVALHWRGPGSITFRTRSPGGRWSVWHDAAPEAEDAPDSGSPEQADARGWHIGNPYWTGTADRIETRGRGRIEQVRAYTIRSAGDSGAEARPLRGLAVAGSPALVSRFAWGANEQLERPPILAPNVRFVVIHHTAGANDYTRQQSAAIVRAIQLYHMAGNGWNDIGYNFLVDRYGQVFEGRAGGIDRPVVGAHDAGFNAGSVGIAVLGSYGATGISSAARAAIANLVAWRLDVAHVDPLSTLSWTSGGNSRFPRGIPVFLRVVSGHRDTGFTDCPGDGAYRALDGIAGAAALVGLPKIYEPRTTGKPGGPVRFTARLSRAGAWRLTISDSAGKQVATSRGTGLEIDWTWAAGAMLPGVYTWTLASGGALAATGTVGRKPVVRPPTTTTGPAVPPPTLTAPGPVPPPTTTAPAVPPTTTSPPAPAPAPVQLVTGFALTSTVLSPNGDGSNDTATVTYTLVKGAYVTAFVLDQSGTVVAQTLFSDQKQSARTQSFTWTPDVLPDGRYRFVVATRLVGGQQSSVGQDVLVDRTLALFGAAPIAFSPNADGIADTTTLSFTLAKPALVALRILAADGAVLALPFTGQLEAGPQLIAWDGSGVAGRLADGAYTAQVTAADGLGDLVQQLTVTIDTVAPTLTLLSGPELRLSLSESATLTVVLDGQQSTLVAGPGDFRVPAGAPPTSFSAVATDAAGNVSGTILWP